MKTIVVDARIINSTTGRYVERLLHHLENIDDQHHYKILVPKKDLDYYQPRNSSFEVLEADFDNYSFAEQIGFNALLKKLDADLVHFCMPQQPILYPGKHVTTVHDLTLINSVAGDKNWLVYKLKQTVGRFVFKRIGQTSSFIISPSHYTSDEYQKFSGIEREKLVVTHLGQVAAYADHHVVIEKDSSGAVTRSAIRALDSEERAGELTRMMAGLSGSDAGRAHAAELLALADGDRAAFGPRGRSR